MLSFKHSFVFVVLGGLVFACGGRVTADPGGNGGGGGGGGGGGEDGGIVGADGGACDGYSMQYCDANGRIAEFCCPAGASCDAPQGFCNLGGGACRVGSCDQDAGVLPPACGVISASSYDQSCMTDTDCVAVFSGSACSQCYCANAAISSSAVKKYEADFQALGPKAETCDCATIGVAKCSDQGTCVLQ